MPRPTKKPSGHAASVPAVPPAQRVKVRELRAHFKELLASGAPLVVGSYWTQRAIVLPVPQLQYYDETPEYNRAEMLRALLEAAIKALR